MKLLNNLSQHVGIILIGKVIGVHGLKGVCKVYSYAESSSFFKAGDTILLRDTRGLEKTYKISWIKPHKQHVVLMSLEGIENCDQAESLSGAELLLNKEQLPEPEENAYYWNDIIGLSVYNSDSKCLGKIESIIQTGSNDVYVVKNRDITGDHEILIPALEAVVLEIDIKQKMMRVALPIGL